MQIISRLSRLSQLNIDQLSRLGIFYRLTSLGGRQYNSYIRNGWRLDEDESLLYPPDIDRPRLVPQNNPTTYEEIMAIHRESLMNLNITLCRECLCAIKIEEGEYCEEHKPQ